MGSEQNDMSDENIRPSRLPEYVLDDLCSRFIINMPEEERADMIRVCFQIELAHWFYIDFYCQDGEMRTCGIKEFAKEVFNHCPFLQKNKYNVEQIVADWKMYKMCVPTYGAILLDPTMQYVLLVQGYGTLTSWSFPKGKVNEDELPEKCAIREVLEETGLDIKDELRAVDFIECQICDRTTGLFIICDVSIETEFSPKTRNEIKKFRWFAIDHLPSFRKDTTPQVKLGISTNNFFTVQSFIRPLRTWIAKTKKELPKVELTNQPLVENGAAPNKPSENYLLRQQQLFASQNYANYENYMNMNQRPRQKVESPVFRGGVREKEWPKESVMVRERKIGSEFSAFKGPKSESPVPKVQKVKHGSDSPTKSGAKKGYQILNRDGTLTASEEKKRLRSQHENSNPFQNLPPKVLKEMKTTI